MIRFDWPCRSNLSFVVQNWLVAHFPNDPMLLIRNLVSRPWIDRQAVNFHSIPDFLVGGYQPPWTTKVAIAKPLKHWAAWVITADKTRTRAGPYLPSSLMLADWWSCVLPTETKWHPETSNWTVYLDPLWVAPLCLFLLGWLGRVCGEWLTLLHLDTVWLCSWCKAWIDQWARTACRCTEPASAIAMLLPCYCCFWINVNQSKSCLCFWSQPSLSESQHPIIPGWIWHSSTVSRLVLCRDGQFGSVLWKLIQLRLSFCWPLGVSGIFLVQITLGHLLRRFSKSKSFWQRLFHLKMDGHWGYIIDNQ